MNKKKKFAKYTISTLASTLIAAAVISAAVSCSSETSSSNDQKNTNTQNSIKANGTSYSKDSTIDVSYGNKVTLTAPNSNNKNVVYKWYCNGQLLKNVTGSKLVVSSQANPNKYYVETITNGVQTKSSTITVNPTFNSSLFSAAIFENTNNKKVINDINNTTSYSLKFELLYNNTIFSLQLSTIYWTINGKQSLQTSQSFIPNLTMGKSIISATCKNLPAFFGIKNNSLSANITINYAQLLISSKNSSNDEVSINYGDTVILNPTNDSLKSLQTAGINLQDVKYQWFSDNKPIKNENNQEATFKNITSNTTYYLKITYSINNQTYSLISNIIHVNIKNAGSKLNNIKVICNNNHSSTLNLNNNLINKSYNFSISYNNPVNSNINGTVTYQLINNNTHQNIILTNDTSSLNDTFNINFDDLKGFSFGVYTLYATVSVKEGNGNIFKYTSTQISPLTITYNAISITPKTNNNVQEVANSNIYNVNIGSNVSLTANLNNLYLAHDNASYQWKYETSSGIWTNVINSSNSTTLTISNVNSLDNKTYILVVTIGDLTLYSNTITINPVIANEASITITSNDASLSNTLNIYNSTNATQTLLLNLNYLNLNDLKDVNITWFVNGQEEQTNSNKTSFEYTYSLGNNKISANLSYSLDGMIKTISTTSDFNINYYDLNIAATNSSISYGINANTDSITINNAKTYLYNNASYQWEVNGELVGNKSNIKPTALPSYNIQQTTTFNLVVTNNNDPNATSIISNSITITPSNTSFTASLNTKYGNNNTLDVYSNVTGTTPSSYKFNLQLEQDEKQYLGTLNNATTTWTLKFNNTIIYTTQTSTLSFNLPISDLTQSGTYTLLSSTKLVGISTVITASYTINYSQLTISSNTGYDGTLTLNNTKFGSIIPNPYYFWQVEESNNSWSTVSTNTSSSSYDVSNLSSSKIYRVIVANNANLNNATIKIISDSYNLNEITTSINVTNATKNNNIYEAKYNSSVTLTASNINLKNSSNVTYQWYCNNKPITDANSSSYLFTQGSSSNSYYVVLYIKDIKQTQSQTITVNPLYDSSKFSLAIYENNNSNNIANTTINDLQNISSYDLSIKLLYDGSVFDTQPTSNIIWTFNDESTSNNNSLNYNASLNVGENLISVKLNDLSNSYGIVGNSLVANLTINYVELEITTSNSRPIVNYGGSITLTQECLSYNSFKSIDTNQNVVSYQWYEVDGSNNEKLSSATSATYTFSNLINNTTYYLVATYTANGTTYTWKSNKITITVNQVPSLVNPKIVCDTSSNSTSLNLDESLINKNPNYEFSIYSNNNAISDINGTVTYTLTNTLNNDKIVLSSSASLDTPFSIDFATLDNFNYGTYTLTASIIIPSANATNITYKATEVDSLTITYNNISINVSSNATQVQNSTTYDAQIGSNVTLTPNKTNVYISNSAPSYQWEEYIDGKWTSVSSTNNTDTLTINNINSGSNLTYRLIETINNLTLTSNSITISPIISNQIKANITSTNTKTVANTLNIYNESQQTQELTLSFSNINTSNLTGLNVEWLVNKKIAQSGTSLSFNHTYNIGTNNVMVNVTYTLNGKTITLTNIASFIINYYSLNIETNSNSISYGSNVDTLSISYEQDSVYENASYQWYVNGKSYGEASTQQPSSLPSYDIQTATTFKLVVSNSSDSSDQTITSNSITITPTNTSSISASLNTTYGSNNILDVYSNVTGTTPSSYKFNLQLEQDEKRYLGTLSNATITWYLNGNKLSTTVGNTLSYELNINELTTSTNTLKASIQLVGISIPITASYTINYSQLNINSSTIYYGNNGTLSINESSFGSLIHTPYYFWQVEESNNSWNTVSTNTSSSSYDVSNLTSSKTYRVIVANSNSLSNASIKLYSNTIEVSPTELSDLSYNIDVNNQTIDPLNTYNTNQTNSNFTFSLSNIKDIAGNINNTNATGTLTWSINSVANSKIIETKTINLTNSSLQNWTDFTYSFSNYGTYIIEAKLAINNNGSQLTKTTNFNFQINVVNITTSYSTKNYATIWLDSQLNSWIGQQNNTNWNNFVNQYTMGYQLNANGADFDNCVAYFQQMPTDDSTGGYEFFTIQAISNKPITVNTWVGSSFQLDSNINTIPAGSLFTWTLPYELSSLTVSNNQISIAMYPYSNWLNVNSGVPTIATPFGLSIGTISNPTAISDDGQYTQAQNGIIGIQYGESSGSPYEAPSSLTANLTSTNIAYSDLSNSNNTITISNKQAITFKSIIDTNNAYSGNVSINIDDEDNNNIGMYDYYDISNTSNPSYTYFFYAPGKYEITFEYTINKPVSETIVQTYYVIYNEISITASTNNPLLGTLDTLSINTSKIYSTYSDSDVTYQWFRIINNTKTAIEDANSSSYVVNINNINNTYEYQLEMTLNGIVYTSNIITLSINSNINPVCNITNTNTSTSNNEINVSSQTTENFNLSITCDGKTYNANNDSLLSNVSIEWSVNDQVQSNATNWNFSYDILYTGTYKISATITFTLFGKQFTLTSSNPITINSTVESISLNTTYNENNYIEAFTKDQLNSWVGVVNNDTWNDFIKQYTDGYQLNASALDFVNCEVYFAPMPSDDSFGSQQFLTIRATSINPISVNEWNNNGFELDSSITPIPAGSIFTWTLPYELSQLSYSSTNNTISLPVFNDENWLDTYTGSQTIATPFGLSIGTSANPTAISGDGQFSQTINNVIEISYGDSANSPFNPTTLTGSYTSSNPYNAFNTNNTLNISQPRAISFNTTATIQNPLSTITSYSGNYTYTVLNKTTNQTLNFSGSLNTNFNIFNYYFYIPGQYEITVQFNLNNVAGKNLTRTQTFYVNYNQITISASNSNPILGSSDTLSVNNSNVFENTTNSPNIQYQWFQIQNGIRNQIDGAIEPTYTFNLNQYNAIYQYQVQEVIGNKIYLSPIYTIYPDLVNFNATANIADKNSTSNSSTITVTNSSTQTFNLQVQCNGTVYNVLNSWQLDDVNIEWLVNNKVQTNQTNWNFNFEAQESGNYTISAIITFSLYGKEFSVKTNVITIDANITTKVSLNTTYTKNGYAQWFLQEQLNTWIGQDNETWDQFINQYTVGYQLQANYTDFTNCEVYFSQMPSNDNFGGKQFLTIKATSTNPIDVWLWSNYFSSFQPSSSISAIPAGSVFIWTVPYELNQLTYSNGNVSIPIFNDNYWWDNNSGAQTIATPFGLSIGTSSNPTLYSGDAQFNQSFNGVIAISYGHSNGSPYNPPASLSNQYDGQAVSYSNFNANNILNISPNTLITFNTTISINNEEQTNLSGTCTYVVTNENTNTSSSGSFNLNASTVTFNYEFNTASKYSVLLTYKLNTSSGIIIKTQTYDVYCNEVSIAAQTLTPKLGTTDTLTANNTFYGNNQTISYQWYKVVNGQKSLIPNATQATYEVNINNYDANYEYIVTETINNTVYTSKPIVLTPDTSNFNATAVLNNPNAINGQINIQSASTQTFNLSINCYGNVFNSSNNSLLKDLSIVWLVNGQSESTTNSNSWSFNYTPKQQGIYEVSASINFTLYGKQFEITTKLMPIQYSNTTITFMPNTATSLSSYVYNPNTYKLVIWGNGEQDDESTVTFKVDTNGSSTNDSLYTYKVEFMSNSNSTIELIDEIPVTVNNGILTLPVSDFNGYSSLKLIATLNNISTSSIIIAYEYLPVKPSFKIASNTSFNMSNPEIILQPNEVLGTATLGTLTSSDLSFSFELNNTTISIKTVNNEQEVNVNGDTFTENGLYSVSVLNQNYVISFNPSLFSKVMSMADPSGSWTTVYATITINNLSLDNESITNNNPVIINQVLGFANTNSSLNNMYTAGVYWNNVPVDEVTLGSTNITLQVTGLKTGDKVAWYEVTSNGNALLNVNGNSIYTLSPTSLIAGLLGNALIFMAVITTATGQNITTNQCTLNVSYLGNVSIQLTGGSVTNSINSPTYSLISNTIYKIETSNNQPVTLNNSSISSSDIYYQWQYKSQYVIIDGNEVSNNNWTNLGTATNSYEPYSYNVVPLYEVSFRLIVYVSNSPSTNFNQEFNNQYIVSNVISTIGTYSNTVSLSSTNQSNTNENNVNINMGQSVTFNLDFSEIQQLESIVKHCDYIYENYNNTTQKYQFNHLYFASVTWYYKDENATNFTIATTQDLTLNTAGQLVIANSNNTNLSYTFNNFNQSSMYTVYAKINFLNNPSLSSSSLYQTNQYNVYIKNPLKFNYETYIQNAIANWANSNNAVYNSTLTSTLNESTFNDLVKQNMAGYEILNNATSFNDIKVSFTSLPSSDANSLGELANEQWLTITATAISQINFTAWNGSLNNNQGGWGTNTVESVEPGTIFTWTLPYALNTLANNTNTLSLTLNETYANASNNEGLYVPFGLSLGSSVSDLTSISSGWNYNYHGVIATNFGTSGEDYILPSTWTVPYNNNAAFVNLFASFINNNVSNFGGIDSQTGQEFITNIIDEWMSGFDFSNISYNSFHNWYVSWSPSKIQNYTVLQISAYNDETLTPMYWDQSLNGGNGEGVLMTNYSIPANSYFTWTLPYAQSTLNMNLSGTVLSNDSISFSDYFNVTNGVPNSSWTTPLGLSIGTSPLAPNTITNSATFTSNYKSYSDSTFNGVIGIGYNTKTPNLSFTIPPLASNSNSNSNN